MERNGIKQSYTFLCVSFFSFPDVLVTNRDSCAMTHFIRWNAYTLATREKIVMSFRNNTDFIEETLAWIQRCIHIRMKITTYINLRVIPSFRNFIDDPYTIK